jgi:hypothetical protein
MPRLAGLKVLIRRPSGRPFYSNFDWLRRIDRQTDRQTAVKSSSLRPHPVHTGTGTLLLLLGPNKKMTHAGPRPAGHFDNI